MDNRQHVVAFKRRYEFRHIACVVLATIFSFLFSIPLTAGLERGAALGLIVTFSLLGALIGSKRRASVGFFYFCLVGVLVMSWLVSFQFITPPGP